MKTTKTFKTTMIETSCNAIYRTDDGLQQRKIVFYSFTQPKKKEIDENVYGYLNKCVDVDDYELIGVVDIMSTKTNVEIETEIFNGTNNDFTLLSGIKKMGDTVDE